jgi:pyrroloquinoline quinone biosynthesis protein D
MTGVPTRAPPGRIAAAAVPRLKPHVRLQFSEARGQWIVQAPERVLLPDDIALAVLQRCDGIDSVAAIAAALAAVYDAPPTEVERDIVELLQDLAEKGIIADARD